MLRKLHRTIFCTVKKFFRQFPSDVFRRYGITGTSDPKKYECSDVSSCKSRQYEQREGRKQNRTVSDEDLRHMDCEEQFEYLFGLEFEDLVLDGEQARDAIKRFVHSPTGDRYHWIMYQHGWAKQ